MPTVIEESATLNAGK